MSPSLQTRRLDGLAAFCEPEGWPPEAQGEDAFRTQAWFTNLARNGVEPSAAVSRVDVRDAAGTAQLTLPIQSRYGMPAALYGRGTESLSNYYSSLFGPAGADAACSYAACEALVRRLGARGQAGNVIDLHPLDQDSVFFRNMAKALAANGYWTDQYFCFGNWYLQVNGRSFDDYAKSLPSKLRNTLRRAQRKMQSEAGCSTTVLTAPGPALNQGIQDFQTIYRQSWKRPEPFPQFIEGLCQSGAQGGWLRLGVLKVQGAPVAAQIWLHWKGRSLIFKLAYDEQYKALSAGSVLTAEMMRHALDVDHAQEVDYLTGDEPYKADWMSHRRERVGLVAFKRLSMQGALSAARHFGGRWWRRSNTLPVETPAPTTGRGTGQKQTGGARS